MNGSGSPPMPTRIRHATEGLLSHHQSDILICVAKTMNVNLPDKKYFTFPELAKRWGVEPDDVSHYVECGELIPSVRVQGIPPFEVMICRGGERFGTYQAKLPDDDSTPSGGPDPDDYDLSGLMYWHNYAEMTFDARLYGDDEPQYVLSKALKMEESTLSYRVHPNLVRVPEPLVSLEEVKRFEAEERSPELVKPLGKNQRHKERCRAIAEYLWDKNPNTTIADVIRLDAINKIGCEGHLYGDKTLREWINDLCPDRTPGRRPKAK